MISHRTKEIEYNKVKTNDWAELQILESSNWSKDSKFINYITGGLNQQIEHHLFPSLSDYHYPNISKIIEEECKLRKINYNNYDSLYSNFISFYNLFKEY